MTDISNAVPVSELTDIPEEGLMPEVCLPQPQSTDDIAFTQRQLFFGAEDDPDREKVAEWHLVDEVCGLFNLYAGIANRKIFLAADEPPASTNEYLEDDFPPFPESIDEWNAGIPALGYKIVPMAARDGFLKNEQGEWRRLDWTPLTNFNVVFKERYKTIFRLKDQWYTIYIIIDGRFISFYTTTNSYFELYPGKEEEDNDETGEINNFPYPAPARWPYSYYLNLPRYGRSNSEMYNKDVYTDTFWDDRICSLPWQKIKDDDTEEKLEEERTSNVSGLEDGQFYDVPRNFVCPRPYVQLIDEIEEEKDLLYLEDPIYYTSPLNWDLVEIPKEKMREIIDKYYPPLLRDHVSLDPAFVETQKKGFPPYDFSPTKDFKVLFSRHFEKTENTWPFWLIVYFCNSFTAPIVSSYYREYNDLYKWFIYYPDDLDMFVDELPSKKEPSGGGEPTDDPGDDTNAESLPDGCFYRGQDGVNVSYTFRPDSQPGASPEYDFNITIEEKNFIGNADMNVLFSISTKDDTGTYDLTVGGTKYALRMYYFLKTSGTDIVVRWQSSSLGPKVGDQEKIITFNTKIPLKCKASFNSISVTSSAKTNWGGNLIKIEKTNETFTKRGNIVRYKPGTNETVRTRYKKKFTVYTVKLEEENLKKHAVYTSIKNLKNIKASFSPNSIRGTSPELNGPIVTGKSVTVEPDKAYKEFRLTGNYRPTYEIEITGDPSPDEFTSSLSGENTGYNTDNGRQTGSISGSFTIKLEK